MGEPTVRPRRFWVQSLRDLWLVWDSTLDRFVCFSLKANADARAEGLESGALDPVKTCWVSRKELLNG